MTLTWPEEPDERLSAYAGGRGSQFSYQIQAAPTISEDFIQERQVYFPNLRYSQVEAAGLIAAQLKKVEGGEDFEALVEERARIVDAIQEDRPQISLRDGTVTRDLNGALDAVQQEITAILERLGPLYVRPKFQTVASNLLNESLRYMYSGEMVLPGSPQIRPYHMMHVWDDTQEMHGPCECGGVLHRFGPEGFYTTALPRLATKLRGADAAMDTAWMSFASEYYSFMGWFSRLGSGLADTAGLAFRGAIYRGVARGAASAALRLSGYTAAKTVIGSSVAMPLFVADAVYTGLTYLYEQGMDKAQHFVGVMTGGMDANPIVLLPMTHRGRPYTAGLTGATGPASITNALEDELNDDSGELLNIDFVETIRRYTTEFGPQRR